MTDTTPQPSVAPAKPANGYTAVVYFHGMGNQRRYEETSRLIDALDLYLSNEFRQRGQSRGMLTRIKPRIEPPRTDSKDNVTYIRTVLSATDDAGVKQFNEARFYECYWAPIMAGSSSPWRVTKWILRQSIRPFQTLGTQWRERQRLRRSALADLQDRPAKWPAETEERDFDKLVRAYSDFDGLAAKRETKSGKFVEFTGYLTKTHEGSPVTGARLVALAEAWRKHYLRTEIGIAFSLASLLLALALAGLLLVGSILSLMTSLANLALLRDGATALGLDLGEILQPSLSSAGAVAVSLLLALGIGRFLTNSMGDVEAWTTYEETDEKHLKRKRVMQMGLDLMAHVLADERCARVIVVSHSLGTSVAHDTILSLANRNRAVNAQNPIAGPIQLEKIRHFVTMGSPIDKINYFFESYRSQFHRYTRVVETLRGDISEVPFSKNRHPHIHWVNYWDEADIISGGLQSPIGRKSLSLRVDNVHVSSLFFPSPGKSHSAYFGNRQVISGLFDMIYLDAHNFSAAPLREDPRGYDYGTCMIGPGDRRGRARPFHAAIHIVPWVGLVSGVAYVLGYSTVAMAALWVVLAICGGLLALRLASGLKGFRLPV